ncbi:MULTISPECIES: cation transporter [Marinobacter]|jgi:Co/Zn/Cd efflux system component|uniref:Cation transporter n=2 Tax=Marinobacter TaxID=2742 RepID=A0A352IQN5_9GAMM|nr:MULTISPECIES: cation transporter [Marinobacter]MBQ92566.1 cation transporter [Marinobacter sp.]MCK5864937.1 cation transporter [Marinobacter adhaerens]MCP4064389.1 cation transporter [Gammaproteobacteria bacterium]PTB99772.1 cation transporter [Marinobacter sp. Z-F4-2]AKV95606.1 cobalt transporter [Marinobacter sp. CP1]|tara:strand:+ start:7247 stop:7900 length:654 start_codon:yes stop_codon:yes gene_type:complete
MACSCSAPEPKSPAPGFRRALWIALWVNLAMFVVEGIASLSSGSVSLMADAIDFFGDSANYILSLTVLSMGMLWRGRAAMVKGITMTVFGLVVWARAVWVVQAGITPEPLTMGAVGLLALTANVSVAAILFKFREGDSDMRSVWLCSRNDAISNIAVMVAALGVFGTGTAWPDLIVAAIMGTLAITAGISVVRHARSDIAEARASEAQPAATPSSSR